MTVYAAESSIFGTASQNMKTSDHWVCFFRDILAPSISMCKLQKTGQNPFFCLFRKSNYRFNGLNVFLAELFHSKVLKALRISFCSTNLATNKHLKMLVWGRDLWGWSTLLLIQRWRIYGIFSHIRYSSFSKPLRASMKRLALRLKCSWQDWLSESSVDWF